MARAELSPDCEFRRHNTISWKGKVPATGVPHFVLGMPVADPRRLASPSEAAGVPGSGIGITFARQRGLRRRACVFALPVSDTL